MAYTPHLRCMPNPYMSTALTSGSAERIGVRRRLSLQLNPGGCPPEAGIPAAQALRPQGWGIARRRSRANEDVISDFLDESKDRKLSPWTLMRSWSPPSGCGCRPITLSSAQTSSACVLPLEPGSRQFIPVMAVTRVITACSEISRKPRSYAILTRV